MRVPVARARAVPIAVGTSLLLATLSGCAESAGLAATSTPVSSPWSYVGEYGPADWGDAMPGCADSPASAQSPIDIPTASLKDSRSASLRLYYHPAAFRVENTGHGIQAVPRDPTANAIELDGTTYHLTALHFHAASEHMIDGIASAAELQLVHVADDGSTAVLAVLLAPGEEQPELGELFTTLSAKAALPGRSAPLARPIDPAALLPRATRVAQYEGSLTEPPCEDGVQWNVFLSPVSVSPEQLSALTGLYPGNHRPVQPLNGRKLAAATVG